MDAGTGIRGNPFFERRYFGGFSPQGKDIQLMSMQASTVMSGKENRMKIGLGITSAVGVVTLLFVGYVFLKAIPDVGRYVRISRM